MSDGEIDDIDLTSFRSTFQPELPLKPAERRRRAEQLCSSFLRNLAFFHAGHIQGVTSGGQENFTLTSWTRSLGVTPRSTLNAASRSSLDGASAFPIKVDEH
jgi:hypothetical protein